MTIQKYKAQWVGGVAVVGMMLPSAPLLAQDSGVSFAGMIRQEMAFNIGKRNPFNQQGIVYNGKPVVSAFGDTRIRPDFTQDNDWNLMATRVELDMNAQISNDWTAFVRLRGFFDNNIYRDYEDPNHFESGFWGDCGGALEICDENYMVDLPSAYLDYSHGPVWLRIGNQQIAWGESLFFRVLDVPNGLDLRRHSFMDWASEEYADERIAAPAIRGSVRFADEWELEGFVQAFSPTIFPGQNTPYNPITSQFVLHSTEAFDDVRGDVTSGLRLKGQIGDLGLQFIAVNRRNPDGLISWTAMGGNAVTNTFGPLGELLAQQPFEPFQGGQGASSAQEFLEYGNRMYVDATALVSQAFKDFPAARFLLDAPQVPLGGASLAQAFGLALDAQGDYVIDNPGTTAMILDAFFLPPAPPGSPPTTLGGLGNMQGHIKRTYPWENVFGFGLNYMISAEQGSLLDQLMLRFEASYTPDKQFTCGCLSQHGIEADEIATSLVVEKYHRFSESFPATYLVFEWLHKTESDMFGRHLSTYNSTVTKSPTGRSDFDAIAFALQQPSKTLMWRFDLAILYDIEGGHFIQPGVRYKPDGNWIVEGYGNFFDGSSEDMMSGLEWADEIGVRIGYQF